VTDLVQAVSRLKAALGEKLQEKMPLAGFTTAQIGGPAAGLVIADSVASLEEAVSACWQLDIPCKVLGNASNVLISDRGFDGVIVINRAKSIRFNLDRELVTVLAGSGSNLGGLARQAGIRGLSGLEWAATVPGTVGGAVYGNAGAHGSDIQANLEMAEILHPISGKGKWTCGQLEYAYRSSVLKRTQSQAVILTAQFRLTQSTKEEVMARMDTFNTRRRATQPPGASMGSMFKNPAGDFAGRLIEAAGLKGQRIGGAEISSMHANFMVNHENATASDVYRLIRLAQQKVKEQSGIELELEIELLGDWDEI